MNRIALVVLCLLTCPPVLALSNQLQHHPSPYLALHGDDPVAWQDWTTSAVELARDQKKLVFVSVGYFSCHWCHVMQNESYKDAAIAEFLNEHFIPVKVDRELEPALDARLIEFAQATQGRAGWPLNVFLTPQGHPLYAVTYMRPENFQQMLQRLQQIWEQDRDKLTALAAREFAPAQGPGEPALDPEWVHDIAQSVVAAAMNMADTSNGGFGQTTKFPMAPQLSFLLDQYERDESAELREFLLLTLDRMAENGMYDHIGDGFFRYTTDPLWDTPHFEKMLYDNAQLAVLYLRAGALFDQPRYERIGRNTLDFMLRDMTVPTGALVASFSAVDDNDVEGGFYLWQKLQLAAVLTQDEKRVAELAWGLEGPLTFEAGYLPKKGDDATAISEVLQIPSGEVSALLESARNKLFQARTGRVLPVDTKLLAGWNGLALASFAEAARMTGDAVYRDAAEGIRNYLLTRLWDGTGLKRAVDGQRALGKAALEDYAYVALGLWQWALLSGHEKDYTVVTDVVDQAWRRFYDGGWRRSESSLISPESVRDLVSDGPMPSPAAVVAELTLLLQARDPGLPRDERTLAALNTGGEALARSAFWHASHVSAMLTAVDGLAVDHAAQ